MAVSIESLESRQLFAATGPVVLAAVGRVQTDLTAVKAALTPAKTTYATDAAALTADAAALPRTAANRRLAATLRRDTAKVVAHATAGAKSVAAGVGSREQARIVADVAAVVLGPSVVADAKLATDVKRIGSLAAGPATKVQASLTAGAATITADLTAIVAANPTDPTLAADAAKATSDATAAAAAVEPELTQIRADLAALLTDLTA